MYIKAFPSLFLVLLVILISGVMMMLSCSEENDNDPTMTPTEVPSATIPPDPTATFTPTVTPTPTPSPTATPTQFITFVKAYGGIDRDEGIWVEQTHDDGYIILGNSDSCPSGHRKVMIIKTDKFGEQIWATQIGSIGINYYGRSIQQTRNWDYIVCGLRYTTTYHKYPFLMRLDETGNVAWERTFNHEVDYRRTVTRQTLDRGFIVTISDSNSYGTYLIKTDGVGNVEWKQNFNDFRAECVQQTFDGGYILSGSSSYISLLKTNATGQMIWMKEYVSMATIGRYVKQTHDGGYIVSGDTSYTALILKTDSIGNLEWFKEFDDNSTRAKGSYIETRGSCVEQTWYHDYIFTAYQLTDPIDPGFFSLVKTDTAGNIVWVKYPYCSIPEFVHQTSDGGFVVCGTGSYSTATHYQIVLVKTDYFGQIW